MEARYPERNLGSEQERLATAKELVAEHDKKRISAGLPALTEETRNSRSQYLADHPVRSPETNKKRRITEKVDAALAGLSGKPIRRSDLARIAAIKVDEDKPGLPPAERRRGLEQATDDLKTQVEERHRRTAETAIRNREVELTRLAGLNLANMPQEISRAAEQNLTDARSPIDASSGWRPSKAAVQAEELRLRSAIADRIEANARAAEASQRAAAEASRREAILQQCRMQAAIAGASVPTPYAGRTMGSALAAGLMGAIQQASTEVNARDSCLRAAGY